MRIKRPKLRKKSTSSTEGSGIKKDELRKFCKQIKWWNVEVVFPSSLIFPQNNDFLKVLWINVFKSLTTIGKKPFFLHIFFSQKLIKKQLKMKGTSGNSKIKASESKLISSSFWPKFRSSPQATIAITYSSSHSWNVSW